MAPALWRFRRGDRSVIPGILGAGSRPRGLEPGLAHFLENPSGGEKGAREEDNLELCLHPGERGKEAREEKRERTVDQGQNLKNAAKPVVKHQPSWLTAARMRSMPSRTFSSDVA